MQVPPGLLKKCNEQSYGVSNMLYCQSVASINVWERRKFINRAPQLAPVLHSHHCSLSETFKCLHISFISPGTWICLLYFLLSWKCVWKRKQGLDVACLYHILFSCVPVQSLCRQDNPILHFLAEAGTVPCSPPHLVTGLSPGKLMSFAVWAVAVCPGAGQPCSCGLVSLCPAEVWWSQTTIWCGFFHSHLVLYTEIISSLYSCWGLWEYGVQWVCPEQWHTAMTWPTMPHKRFQQHLLQDRSERGLDCEF